MSVASSTPAGLSTATVTTSTTTSTTTASTSPRRESSSTTSSSSSGGGGGDNAEDAASYGSSLNSVSQLLRDVANEAYRRGDPYLARSLYSYLARSLYSSALHFCWNDPELKSTLYLNRSACHLKVSRPAAAAEDASLALQGTLTHATTPRGSAKALYRRATAAYACSRRVQALQDAKKSFEINADPVVAKLIERIQKDPETEWEFRWSRWWKQAGLTVALLGLNVLLFAVVDLGGVAAALDSSLPLAAAGALVVGLLSLLLLRRIRLAHAEVLPPLMAAPTEAGKASVAGGLGDR